ncbi:hypothetical protein DRW07_14880 [Alteromonas sediminis]|uniref:Uncharacterized protein n=1 Tax=Alteromonas sediminis TaxID=2259342 RepID=A0A3N5YLL9_9ALTE|nr:hypothetical protein [Alteromonas sediminis]RPJ66081.1 hypothetical protein DRW07_14880 [Alteromonas sediminis]
MNDIEKDRYKKILSLMEAYESKTDSSERESVLEQINEIVKVGEFEVNEYYGSCSLEEFCRSLAIIPCDGNSLNKSVALEIVKDIVECEDIDRQEYLLSKYSDAIEFAFKKNSGFLEDCIFKENISLNEISSKLEGETDGPIAL